MTAREVVGPATKPLRWLWLLAACARSRAGGSHYCRVSEAANETQCRLPATDRLCRHLSRGQDRRRQANGTVASPSYSLKQLSRTMAACDLRRDRRKPSARRRWRRLRDAGWLLIEQAILEALNDRAPTRADIMRSPGIAGRRTGRARS